MSNSSIDPKIQLLDFEKPLAPLFKKATKLLARPHAKGFEEQMRELKAKIQSETKKIYSNLNNWNCTQVARHPQRPYALDYIERIFTDFIELHGDRNFGDDASIVCGLAKFEAQPVVIVAQQKGRSTDDNIKRNFGMSKPEGYRKALRFFELAQKFNKPIVTFIDTPGAYPGLESEKRSQAEAIARNLKRMASLSVPIYSVVIGEGGSGGALGIAVANHVAMLENSTYSVISPESCASILWHDANEKEKAAEVLKSDAKTALKLGAIDEIIAEALGGAHRGWDKTASNIKASLAKIMKELTCLSPDILKRRRIEKFSKIGVVETI